MNFHLLQLWAYLQHIVHLLFQEVLVIAGFVLFHFIDVSLDDAISFVFGYRNRHYRNGNYYSARANIWFSV